MVERGGIGTGDHQRAELVGMVTTAYAMRVVRKDRPAKEGERGEISSAMQWEINKVGGEGERNGKPRTL